MIVKEPPPVWLKTSLRTKGINKMIDLFKKAFGYILLYILKDIPGTQEACNKEVQRKPCYLAFIPDHLIPQEMCNEAVQDKPCILLFVPDHLKTRAMCEKAVRMEPCSLGFKPNHFKTQEMCNEAIEEEPVCVMFLITS